MSVFLFALFVLVVQVFLSLFEIVLFAGFGPMMGVQDDGSYGGPVPVLYGVALRLLYAFFAVAAVAWAFTVRAGWVASVAERIRWRVLLWSLPALVVAGRPAAARRGRRRQRARPRGPRPDARGRAARSAGPSSASWPRWSAR